MPQEIEIPGGGGKKLPGWVLLAGGAVVVLILLMKKGGEEQGDYDTSGLLASELNQRLQEMEESLAQALEDAQGQAPTDQTEPPGRPINPRFPTPTPQTPEDDGLHPVPYDPVRPQRPTRPPRQPGRPPGGVTPSTVPIPPRIESDRQPEPERPGGGLPPRLTTAPLGTRAGHESRIRFIEEAGDSDTSIHREARNRQERESPTLNQTNITSRSSSTPTRKQEREKKSPILKSKPKEVTQAASTSQKMKKKAPTVRKGRKR